MTLEHELKDGCALLRIEGPMTVNEASALREEMVGNFDACDGLILDMKNVTECDVAGIQLLCSALLTAKSTGKNFNVAGASMTLRDALARAGLDPDAILALNPESFIPVTGNP